MVDRIEKLYANYEVLSDALAKGKIAEHEAAYRDILNAVQGDEKEKKLASQFIGKFFKNFPKLQEEAMDRQLDLCEDEDIAIRRQVRGARCYVREFDFQVFLFFFWNFSGH